MTYHRAMDAAQALVEVRRLALQGRVQITHHAAVERFYRHGGRGHILHALVHADEARASRPEHRSDWVVTGPDLDGDAIDLAVVIEADVVVITVF